MAVTKEELLEEEEPPVFSLSKRDSPISKGLIS